MDKLNNIWSLFQNLDGFVYASDVETYEMVYLNRKAMDTLGVKSIDEMLVHMPMSQVFGGSNCYKAQSFHVDCVPIINYQ